MIRNLLIMLATTTAIAHANTGRTIRVEGFLVKIEGTRAVIKDDKGLMNVPAAAIDREHFKIGQWVNVSLDFVDFYRLNPKKFQDSNWNTRDRAN